MTTSVSTTQHQSSLLDDRFAITDLVYALGAALDEHRFDDLRDLFIENATVSTPGGAAQGRDAVIAQATRNHLKYARLQHSMTNVLVESMAIERLSGPTSTPPSPVRPACPSLSLAGSTVFRRNEPARVGDLPGLKLPRSGGQTTA